MDGSDNNQQPGTDVPQLQPLDSGPPVGEKMGEASTMSNKAAPDLPLPNSPIAGGIVPGPSKPSQIDPPPLAPQQSPSIPAPQNTTTPATGPIPIPVNDALPSAAEDSDLIEKEWVNKAKYIVESTKNDPHLLNKELNKFKADYIQKRYHKQLKVSDD